MSYSVEIMTEELMLDPSDVREIFDAFFEDSYPLIKDGIAALQAGDRQLLSRKMHALKGSALNLRMDELGNLASQAEKNETLSVNTLLELMIEIQAGLEAVEASVNAFYLASR